MRDHQDVSDSESALLASEHAVRWSISLTSVVITVDALLFFESVTVQLEEVSYKDY